jgi:hypothetical protein
MSIDVRRWHREGLLCAGQRFSHPLTWTWMPTESVDVVIEADAVVLIRRSRSWGGEFGQRQRVPITWTPCSLGGRRPWFRCDEYYGGRYCGRRVALLYSGGGPFACRHCRRLVYASQNETPTLRAINRVRKIRMRSSRSRARPMISPHPGWSSLPRGFRTKPPRPAAPRRLSRVPRVEAFTARCFGLVDEAGRLGRGANDLARGARRPLAFFAGKCGAWV